MKNQKEINAVVEFIKKNPDSSTEVIVVGTKMGDIMVRGVLKNLLEDDVITADPDTGTYSIAEQSVETPAAEKKTETKVSKKKDDDLGPKTIYPSRDNSKYRFGEHRNLPKGRLVLELVRAYVDKNKKISLSKLQEVFHSDEIQPRFGIISELSAARKFSKNKVDRHFVKNPEDIIKLANGTKVAVCNQWTAEGLAQLLKVVAANPIGFKVSVEKAAE